MKKLFLLFGLVTCLGATSAQAQLLGNNERYSQYVSHVNVGLDGIFNVNPGAKTYKPGAGASIKYQYDVTQNLGFTIGAGYFVLPADRPNNINRGLDLKLIPLRLGAKAYFLPEWYFGGEVGVAYADPYIDSKSQSHFSKLLAPAVGWETNHLDVSFRYENVNHQAEYVSFVALRVAYLFNF